jgi:spore protease
MGNYQIRTDLALEAREGIGGTNGRLNGVRSEEYDKEEAEVHVTKVMIDTRNAAKLMGKPVGIYVTIEAPNMVEPDEDFHAEMSDCLADE